LFLHESFLVFNCYVWDKIRGRFFIVQIFSQKKVGQTSS